MDNYRGIVPSNAPLHDGILDEISLPNRVLQERCGNRQQEYLDPELPDHRKHALYPPTENVYGGNVPSYVGSHQAYSSFLDEAQEEQELSKESYHLFRMLMRSDAYKKYRMRQPKDKDSKDQEQTWPDHMERAFFLALVKYPPMGRRKQMYEGKPRGRNELIAFAIEKWTGEARTRKQVSSHIQVLKPLFKEYPKIMKYMAKDDSEHRSNRHHHSEAAMLRRRMPGYHQIRQLDFNCVDQGITYSSQRDDPLPPPSHVLTSNTTAPDPSIEPGYFEMYVHDTSQGTARSLHTFTKIEDRPEHSALVLTDASQEALLPHHLRELLGGKTPECNVIIANASIALMDGKLPQGVELGINLELTTTYDHTSVDHFESNAHFFSGANGVVQCDGQLGYSLDTRRLHAKTGIFASGFWARKFVELSSKLREANRKHNNLMPNRGQAAATDEDVQRLRDGVREELSGLSAVQEIFAVRRTGYEGQEFTAERILIIGWTFKQAERGKPGRTSWKRVIFPSPPKEELPKQEHQPQQYAPLTLELPANPNPAMLPSTQSSFDQSSFELDPLSTIGMTGLPTNVSSAAPPLPDMSQEDFTGGHINIYLEPTMSMQGYYDISSQPSPLDPSGGMATASQQSSYDQMQAYPRQWSNYAGLENDIYGQHMQSYQDSAVAAAAAQHSGYGRPHGQTKDEAALAAGHYMGHDVHGGRRDSGMLGM
ncbi:TEA-domain-containing protein [Saccharata proteae CBS 121410]|uniref:TEA-domain-containing protein n=1 Tax=Saccharata proteae CBS 121410 TaxID=1314787 RepID=A0A9P4HZZ4_9PEZI|nr:TEA-domain-containing protein [Saccharata proteae CBS 121410]